MNPWPFIVVGIIPLLPVRWVLWGATGLLVWLIVSLAVHFLIFRPLFLRNERQ